ncbi:hypothetical protein [Herpetosiphon geysericola]|uniref:Uncharacterized protein n=1 Tax=Herpetosiphon geysericola TaxID=70996 RepID=A0A0P6X9E1_9CHLR|nr:hypothetical protein [Herpetosiphon geysericola]KPL79478.1 hypothetical protein SE18_26315 [Herpetosiphon geysericola]
MARQTWTRRSAILAGLLLALWGCGQYIAPATKLAINPNADSGAYYPAIYVDNNDLRHYAWAECQAGNGCDLIYSRMRGPNEVLRHTISADNSTATLGYTSLTGDISGTIHLAYLSNQTSLTQGEPSYRPYVVSISPDGATVSQPVSLQGESINNSLISPIAVRNTTGSRVGVVYTMLIQEQQTTKQALVYRQIVPSLSQPVVIESVTTNIILIQPHVGIDSNDQIHVVYGKRSSIVNQRNFGGDPTLDEIRYAHGDLSGMTARTVDSYTSASNIIPFVYDLSLSDNVYVTYIKHPNGAPPRGIATDSLRIHNATTNVTSDLVLPSIREPWSISEISTVSDGTGRPTVYFAGSNNSFSDPFVYDVWQYDVQASDGINLTNTPAKHENNLASSRFQLVDLVAWQADSFSSSGCTTQIISYRSDLANQLHIAEQFLNPLGCTPSVLQMSVGNDVAAGVWISVAKNNPTLNVPATAFNSYGTFLPITQR